jgi:hypothetical protein
MSKKHDFKETLFYFKGGHIESDTIQYALRLADRLQLPPKLKDLSDIKEILSRDCDLHDDYIHEVAHEIYQKITTQLMKEVENE